MSNEIFRDRKWRIVMHLLRKKRRVLTFFAQFILVLRILVARSLSISKYICSTRTWASYTSNAIAMRTTLACSSVHRNAHIFNKYLCVVAVAEAAASMALLSIKQYRRKTNFLCFPSFLSLVPFLTYTHTLPQFSSSPINSKTENDARERVRFRYERRAYIKCY